jgi:hypothetical protein
MTAAGSGVSAPTLRDVHVARFAADEGFVGFHFAGELVERSVMQREAQPMRHEPRRLLRDADAARNLARADAVLAVHEQPKRSEPLVEAERGILENRSGLQRELGHRMLLVALPAADARQPNHPL